MKVQGCDCSIVIKTTHHEFEIQAANGGGVQSNSLHSPTVGRHVPYSEETIREEVSLLQEEASIEGDGVCRGLRKSCGVTGCVVTPLTIGTAPLLLYLAMGSAGVSVFVSETRDLYKCQLHLLPLEDADQFDLIQDRQIKNAELTMNNERRLFEGCKVKSFELRIIRGEAVKLKLDITSERPAVTYPYVDMSQSQTSEMSGTVIGNERFNGDGVAYQINGKEYTNIYGVTLSSKKEGCTKTELWIKRALDTGSDIPHIIDEMIITAQLLRDTYEYRQYGTFRIILKKLVLISDETNVNSSDTVIGLLRYYVAGNISTDVFTSNEGGIA